MEEVEGSTGRGGREVVGAALNRLLRLAFTLIKKQTLYQSPQLVQVTG